MTPPARRRYKAGALSAVLALGAAIPVRAGGGTGFAMVDPDGPGGKPADATVVIWNDNGDVRVEDRGGYRRLYLLGVKRTLYVARKSGGAWQVHRLTPAQAGHMPFGAIAAARPQGVAKRLGRAHERLFDVTVMAGGTGRTEAWELTDDPATVAMTRAYVDATTRAAAPTASARALEGALFAGLPADMPGILRAGNGYQLRNIVALSPPPLAFRLPAKPSATEDAPLD